MEIETMGRVTVTARIENLDDLVMLRKGLLQAEQVRWVEVDNALVDTGATSLSMPKKLIERLGLEPIRTRKAVTTAGPVTVQVYAAVRLIIQERDCIVRVTELPDECPVLIGQIPLEDLDFIVDLQARKLIGNPAHGGEQMIELY